MIPITSAISGGLIWSKASHKLGYELKSNGEVVASLHPVSRWSPEFEGESQSGKWRFRRTGFWRGVTEIVDAHSGAQIAVLKPNWRGGGTLFFSDGQRFQVTAKGFWQPVWSVLAESGLSILNTHSRKKTVEFPNELQLSEDRLVLLTVFIWHVIQQAAQDAAAAAVVVAASS
jgi:hypothetical protein